MRRAPSLIALLCALVACTALGAAIALEVGRATPADSPRAAIERAAAERADARERRFTDLDRTFDRAYDPEMVRDRVEWRSGPGAPPTTDVTIVNATPEADLAESARACATAIARETKTRVQCYAFADTESYSFKNITGELDATQPLAIVNLCWAVMASNDRAGAPITLNDMRQAAQVWQAQGCPDSWIGAGSLPKGAA